MPRTMPCGATLEKPPKSEARRLVRELGEEEAKRREILSPTGALARPTWAQLEAEHREHCPTCRGLGGPTRAGG